MPCRTRPPCDLCHERPAAVDGKTKMGPWAYMCVPCFESTESVSDLAVVSAC